MNGDITPPFGARLTPGHPLCVGLTGAWVLNTGSLTNYNLVDGKVTSYSSSVSLTNLRRGPGIQFSAGTAAQLVLGIDSQLFPVSDTFSIVAVLRRVDDTERATGLFGPEISPNSSDFGKRLWAGINYNDGGGYDVGAFLNVGNGGTSFQLIDIVPNQTAADDVWAWTNGIRGIQIWKNGVDVISGSRGTRDITNNNFVLGKAFTSAVNSDGVNYHAFYIWKRQLTASEIITLARNPYEHISVNRLPRVRSTVPPTTLPISSSITGDATVSAVVNASRSLSSTISASASSTFVAGRNAPLSTAITSDVSTPMVVKATRSLTCAITGDASMTGELRCALAAAISAATTMTADVKASRAIASTISASASMTGVAGTVRDPDDIDRFHKRPTLVDQPDSTLKRRQPQDPVSRSRVSRETQVRERR